MDGLQWTRITRRPPARQPGPSSARGVSDGQPPRADPDAQTLGATSAREKGNDDANIAPARPSRRVGISKLESRQGKENKHGRGGVEQAGKKKVAKALSSLSSKASK